VRETAERVRKAGDGHKIARGTAPVARQGPCTPVDRIIRARQTLCRLPAWTDCIARSTQSVADAKCSGGLIWWSAVSCCTNVAAILI
jgi:hypothetical protein